MQKNCLCKCCSREGKMLRIKEYDHNNNYRKLKNDPQVFHNALRYVLKGEKRFHVGEGKEEDFDLVYQDNDARAKKDHNFPDSDFFYSEIIFPPYLQYDENDMDRIDLSILNGHEEIFFEETNEYSAVIASLALKHTKMRVTFKDDGFRRFPWIREAVQSAKPLTENALYVQKWYYPIFEDPDRFSTTGLFHAMFLLQWVSDLPKQQLKYICFSIRKTEGIGSILASYNLVAQAFEKYGLKVFIEPDCTRFSSEMLAKYFVLGNVPEDSDETNTAYVQCFNSFVLNFEVQRNNSIIDLKMLQPGFVAQMKEYADAVLGEKKVLGVLLRGTDYTVANFAGSFHPAPIEECIRIVDERIREHGYDKIFVATEDSYYLERMIMAFPGKVIAVSQERHDVSEFTDVRYISDLEKKQYRGDAYYASVEDTTVNYFYAMYLLSRCESLVSNCMCNGVKIASSFNRGSYVRTEIVSEMMSRKK